MARNSEPETKGSPEPCNLERHHVLMSSSVKSAVQTFINQEKLPPDYAETVQQWFLPLAETLLHKVAVSSETMVVGISGCQGSGKSTLASLLVVLLRELIGLNSVSLSIDDFYLSHADRQTLAQTVHPLLATRGVPGTHDVRLAVNTIEALKGTGRVAIPRFSKALDDRLPEPDWPQVQAPLDVIIVEGWCLNIGPQNEADLQTPVNLLEENEDQDGKWRTYVNNQLVENYSALYNLVDYLVMLKAPSFDKVFEWRQTQEDKLASRHDGSTDHKIMNTQELKRFIHHYERLTRHGLISLPEKADTVFQLSDEQTILGIV